MKKIAVPFVALSAVTGAALAFESDNQAPYRPGETIQSPAETFVPKALKSSEGSSTGDIKWYSGKYGLTTDPDDIRRWSEKN
jgi:hypothetical protein